MKKHITATVPQGIGDIFWIYQKLYPLAEKISFKIAILYDCEIERRAENIITCWPKVESVTIEQMDYERYKSMMYGEYYLPDLIKTEGNEIEIDYSLNHFMDAGIKLEQVDTLPVEYDIALPCEPINGIDPGYILFYVSGTTMNKLSRETVQLWTVEEWAELISNAIHEFGRPVYITGANFDADVMRQLKELVPELRLVIQPPAKKLFWLIKNCDALVGYQSGINVLAENFARKQIHVFFPHMQLMRDAWVKPCRRNTHFKICFFTDPVETAFNQLKELLGHA